MNTELLQDLIDLTTSTNVSISNAATAILSLFYQRDNNEISNSELYDLVKDIVLVAEIQDNMDNVEYYRLATVTINAILAIKSMGSLL
jgi:hypothetical protein